MDKFDTFVDQTLKSLYSEMQSTTQLTGTEKAAVDDAVDTNSENDPNQPVNPQQKQLADLAAKRKQQLQQVAGSATNKLQRQVTQPITQ